jgi:hypothetical protein
MEQKLWFLPGCGRYFLIADELALATGDTVITSLVGDARSVDGASLAPFEVTEDQAHRWAKDQLGTALDDLKQSLDQTLAEWRTGLEQSRRTPVVPESSLTPSGVGALFELLRSLPRIVGQGISGDEERVAGARQSLADLKQKLAEGGIELDDRFTRFADCLASLRKEAEERKKPPGEDPS